MAENNIALDLDHGEAELLYKGLLQSAGKTLLPDGSPDEIENLSRIMDHLRLELSKKIKNSKVS